VEEIVQRLRNHLHEQVTGSGERVYVVDRSTLQLEASAELKRVYPPARNPRRLSYWPVMRMVVLHDMDTGLAEQPCWGPMHGPEVVSEQTLAERALERVPPGAVIVGDRNFEVFSMAHAIHQRGQKPLLRLTQERAQRLIGGLIAQPGVYPVEWRPSAFERSKHRKLPTDAVSGMMIGGRVGRGKKKRWLYLFTTLSWAPEEVFALYGKRWQIETDLRSLKQTVRLNRLVGPRQTCWTRNC